MGDSRPRGSNGARRSRRVGWLVPPDHLLFLAAAPEPPLTDCIACLLTLADKFDIRHDGLIRMVRSTVGNIRFIVGYPDHQTRSARRPIDRCSGCLCGAIE